VFLVSIARLRLAIGLAFAACNLLPSALEVGDARAAAGPIKPVQRVAPAPALRGLSLSASPGIVDVGDNVLLVLSARSWPRPVKVTVSFLSGHHGFTGQMIWSGSCACFRIAVSLARRIHPLERARAVATIVMGRQRLSASAGFWVRGLAANGRDFAPGGPQTLSAWVSDPQPLPRESVHVCAWVKTPDGLGVGGMKVRFLLRFGGKSQAWNAGVTNQDGIACSRRTVAANAVGHTVSLDAYAGALHVQTRFSPKA
jgi:hypothetical protein